MYSRNPPKKQETKIKSIDIHFFIPPLRAQADIERKIVSYEWTVASITRSLLLLVSDVAELEGAPVQPRSQDPLCTQANREEKIIVMREFWLFMRL